MHKIVVARNNQNTLIRVFTLCLCILCISGCSKLKGKVEPKPHWFKYYSAYNNSDYLDYFKGRIQEFTRDSLSPNKTVWDWLYYDDMAPIWTINGLQEHKVGALMEHLAHAYEHGIAPAYFGYDTLHSRIQKLKEHGYDNNDSLYPALFSLEYALTEAYAKYAHAMQYGATDPKVVNGGKWLYKMSQPDSTYYQQLVAGIRDMDPFLTSLEPTDDLYQQLQEELLRLYPMKDTVLKEIPVKSVKAGQSSPIIPLVCQRLRLTGELPEEFPDTTILTSQVLEGINQFRSTNNIPTCDSLGKETIEKLNRPVSYYINRLSANMERLRWKTASQKGKDYIAVNIPDFTLQAFVDKKCEFKTRICCGKTQNPKNNPSRTKDGITRAHKAETPLLYSKIRRIVLNPEWNIPYDIIKNEYYHKLCKNNTAVINREHLFIKDSRTGNYVDPETIDWNQVNRNNIPYRLIQSSGRYNALGQVKFDFANTESVYLHDTNNKGAFKRRVRTFSHGCVRVENPLDLVDLLYAYNEFDEWKLEQLGMLIGKKPETERGKKYLEKMEEKEAENYEKLSDEEKKYYRKLRPTSVYLTKQMPLFIEYYTCFIGEKGDIQYREDIYYKDDNILHQLCIK